MYVEYLYRTRLDGSGLPERISPANQVGTHNYNVSPSGSFALHRFSNYYTPGNTEWVSLPGHTFLGGNSVSAAIAIANKSASGIEFFTIKTSDGVAMDAWMVKPTNFDATKKYPVVFFVYTEPWGQEVKDQYGITRNAQYDGIWQRMATSIFQLITVAHLYLKAGHGEKVCIEK